ncbi:LOW QUALITY PROTEIN: hypothetical protein OSB04_027995 [Centaurea solstitialis]|uniref:Transposase n=1 Tax=Centaurea solstitialis TaxID=347529 RepID=A0AA38W8T5_9ASTR|nr:LOW QUALITY PROTEIN: hypothetical protein OSB04_027995 [Centaurea solstitialis]
MATTQESSVNEDHSDDDLNQDHLEHIQSGIPSENTSVKKKRRLVSGVWKDFAMIPPKPGEPLYCKCKNCGRKYLAGSRNGTGNLRRHLKSCLKKQQGISDHTWLVLTKNLLLQLTRILVKTKYEGIRILHSYMAEQVVHISRNTTKSDIKKTYQKEMIRLRGELVACPGRICLTSDAWTSIATDGYLSLTAHYLDSNWVLQKRILNFCYFPPPHSGIALSKKIISLIKTWGIEKKLFSITLDNASANDTCVGYLKENLTSNNDLLLDGTLFHVQCCAHILNLIVQDGLKEIDGVVYKIRECVKYIRGSEGRKIKFYQCVSQMSLENNKGLHQDVPTRWNSTYIMLSGAFYYRRALVHLHLVDSNFQSCPTQEEWEKVEKICEFLEIFYDATNSFSGSRYPTSNLFFRQAFFIQLTLVQKLQSPDLYMKKIAQQMFEKFNKYWSEFNVLLTIAVVFDPRYMFAFLDFSYTKLYGPHSQELSKIKTTLFSPFDEYMKASTSNTTFSTHVGSNSGTHSVEGRGKNKVSLLMRQEFQQFKSNEYDGFGNFQRSQLELYLDEPSLDVIVEFDVLDFWKSQYPDLSKLARDLLCIPVSIVASESAFSLGGRILDQYRSSMSPATVEALVCTRDWLFGGTVVTQMKLDEVVQNIMASDSYVDETDATRCETFRYRLVTLVDKRYNFISGLPKVRNK